MLAVEEARSLEALPVVLNEPLAPVVLLEPLVAPIVLEVLVRSASLVEAAEPLRCVSEEALPLREPDDVLGEDDAVVLLVPEPVVELVPDKLPEALVEPDPESELSGALLGDDEAVLLLGEDELEDVEPYVDPLLVLVLGEVDAAVLLLGDVEAEAEP